MINYYLDKATNFIGSTIETLKSKVVIQSILLIGLAFFMFNAGRVIERDMYVKILEQPYPLDPQPYFGGIRMSEKIAHSWRI